MAKKRRRKKKGLKIILLLIFILLIIGVVYYLITNKKIKVDDIIPVVEEKKLSIIDENSKTRPIAVMINNHNKARPYHSGLQEAYVVYEMIVEGGLTRYMAIFKDANTDRIGSVRSSRHNFLDYALEYDAIYVHYGWSPKAQSDISSLGINNINGLYDANCFWRDKALNVPSEHTAFTSMEKIKQIATEKGYSLTSTNSGKVLNYTTDDVSLEPKQVTNENGEKVPDPESDSVVANKVKIPYSSYVTTSYEYDATNKVYNRFVNGTSHSDYITKKQYNFKNIIVMNVYNYSMDSYGRQDLNTVGTGTGYYITNGYARPITWSKKTRNSKTTYMYNDGSEIEVNDGNTFIQVQPTSKTTTFE